MLSDVKFKKKRHKTDHSLNEGAACILQLYLSVFQRLGKGKSWKKEESLETWFSYQNLNNKNMLAEKL